MGYTSIVSGNPIQDLPNREVFSEGVLNIARVVEQEIANGNADPNFGGLSIAKISRGRMHPIKVWPSLEVSFFFSPGVDEGSMESEPAGSAIVPIRYRLRYFHSTLDVEYDDLQITRQLGKLHNLLYHHRTLNSFCRGDSMVRDISQGVEVFRDVAVGEKYELVGVAGGQLFIDVNAYYRAFSREDGVTDRIAAPETGDTY